jgi:hypothetical protein
MRSTQPGCGPAIATAFDESADDRPPARKGDQERTPAKRLLSASRPTAETVGYEMSGPPSRANAGGTGTNDSRTIGRQPPRAEAKAPPPDNSRPDSHTRRIVPGVHKRLLCYTMTGLGIGIMNFPPRWRYSAC